MFKNCKTICAVALMGFALSASAQFTGGNSKADGIKSSAANTNPYNRVSLSYENMSLNANDKMEGYFNGEDDMYLNGFGIEYIHGFSVSKTLPMFVEAGIKAQLGFGSVSQDDKTNGYEVEQILKAQQFSLCVPVNYTYRFAIGNDMNIAPYLGLNFKLHLMSRVKEVFEFDDEDMQEYWDENYADESDWMNVFDKKDMGDKDATWNRFQMGWHIGAGFQYKALYLGLQYGTDFIPAFKYKKQAVNSGTFSLKVGYCF